ncbi:MAG: hypothetical protein ABIH87_03285 [bacterium]
MLSEESIKEFQQIVKEEYGEELTFKNASEIANGLVDYFSILKELRIKNMQDDNKK